MISVKYLYLVIPVLILLIGIIWSIVHMSMSKKKVIKNINPVFISSKAATKTKEGKLATKDDKKKAKLATRETTKETKKKAKADKKKAKVDKNKANKKKAKDAKADKKKAREAKKKSRKSKRKHTTD